MNEPDAIPKKSKWKKILGIGCLGVVVLLVAGVLAANYFFKRAVVEHLERKMADAGFVGKVGEFDYSIARRELLVRDLRAGGSRQSEHRGGHDSI